MGMEVTKDSMNLNFKGMVIWAARIVTIIFVVAISIYIIKFGVFWPISSLGTLEQFGSFGDFIGGLMNPLLQFVVIFLLLWSIQVQRNELTISNKTLHATQEELQATKVASEQQAIELEKQTFILRTQQQDNLDQIKVKQELTVLERQRVILAKAIGHENDLAQVRSASTLMMGADNTRETETSEVLPMAFYQFSLGLCGLLKCKNIPLTASILEIQWFISQLDLAHNSKFIKYEIVVSISSNLSDAINESTLTPDRKEYFIKLVSGGIKH